MRRQFFLLGFCGILIVLTGCSGAPTYAPVVEISAIEPIPKTGMHKVTNGETMYEVAWRYGLDYRDVAVRGPA